MLKDKTANQDDGLVRRLLEAGAHYGYSKTRNHPSTAPFIYGFKNRSAIIDLEKTVSALERARQFLAEVAATGKQVLWVGNKDEARGVVEQTAVALGAPYVASRWLGGTFTNYDQIKSRIDRLADLKAKRESGELGVYTKKEQLLFSREIAKLERYLASLSGFTGLPGAVVVADSNHEAIVVAEARKMGVPIVSLSNTDCDLRGIAYPIVVNDASAASLKIVLEILAAAYERGVTDRAAAQVAAAATAPATPVAAA
jgi:small subunit ribosomal protein S2